MNSQTNVYRYLEYEWVPWLCDWAWFLVELRLYITLVTCLCTGWLILTDQSEGLSRCAIRSAPGKLENGSVLPQVKTVSWYDVLYLVALEGEKVRYHGFWLRIDKLHSIKSANRTLPLVVAWFFKARKFTIPVVLDLSSELASKCNAVTKTSAFHNAVDVWLSAIPTILSGLAARSAMHLVGEPRSQISNQIVQVPTGQLLETTPNFRVLWPKRHQPPQPKH